MLSFILVKTNMEASEEDCLPEAEIITQMMWVSFQLFIYLWHQHHFKYHGIHGHRYHLWPTGPHSSLASSMPWSAGPTPQRNHQGASKGWRPGLQRTLYSPLPWCNHPWDIEAVNFLCLNCGWDLPLLGIARSPTWTECMKHFKIYTILKTNVTTLPKCMPRRNAPIVDTHHRHRWHGNAQDLYPKGHNHNGCNHEG